MQPHTTALQKRRLFHQQRKILPGKTLCSGTQSLIRIEVDLDHQPMRACPKTCP
jgi:hypothetical protein